MVGSAKAAHGSQLAKETFRSGYVARLKQCLAFPQANLPRQRTVAELPQKGVVGFPRGRLLAKLLLCHAHRVQGVSPPFRTSEFFQQSLICADRFFLLALSIERLAPIEERLLASLALREFVEQAGERLGGP